MKIVIFAGGVGTRLWPLSRKNTPKQFEKIVNDQSMLQIAVQKLFPQYSWKDIYISTGKQYKSIISQQLPKLPLENIIPEPAMRDVGPAVGLVTSLLIKSSPDEPVALLWGSDHLVKKDDVFREALKAAEEIISKNPDKIVFLGQKPRFASENLGYISFGEKNSEVNGIPIYEFKGLKYRPDIETAKKFVADGHHSWNLGYFVTTPRFLWKLFKEFAPELFDQLLQISNAYGTNKYEEILGKIYPSLEKINFDNAILEKMNAKDGYALSLDIGWSDVGAWEALKEALSDTEDQNVEKGKVLLEDSRDSLAFNYTDQLVVGIDLNQMLVINTGDVVLVCPKTSVPKIKKLVENLVGTPHEHLT